MLRWPINLSKEITASQWAVANPVTTKTIKIIIKIFKSYYFRQMNDDVTAAIKFTVFKITINENNKSFGISHK